MKKISIAGLILGMVLGAAAGLLVGKWLFWLGAGLAIGVVALALARRSQVQGVRVAHEAKS